MIKQYLKDSAAYLWSGWGATSALLLFTALWEFGHQIYGSLILPSPIETMQSLGGLYDEGIVIPASLITAKRAGFSWRLVWAAFWASLLACR